MEMLLCVCTYNNDTMAIARRLTAACIPLKAKPDGLDLGIAANTGTKRINGLDSEAAKSFVCRKGLGKMRHLHIRDLWLQREVAEGNLEVIKIAGEGNPADFIFASG